MSNILFFCHLERNQKETQKKYWYQKQVLLSRRAVLCDAVCLENATLEKWVQGESRQTGRQSQETGLLPPATHAQRVSRMMAMSSYGLLPVRLSLLTGSFITRRHSCVYTVSNINHKRNYVCYGRLWWTGKELPWPICYTSRILCLNPLRDDII